MANQFRNPGDDARELSLDELDAVSGGLTAAETKLIEDLLTQLLAKMASGGSWSVGVAKGVLP